MPTTKRSSVTAGFALVGAGVISAAPITTPQPETRQAHFGVDLVAAIQSCTESASAPLCGAAQGQQPTVLYTPAAEITNVFNIPANMFIALANTPFNFFTALGEGNVQLGSEPDGGPSFQPTYEGITLAQPAGNVVGLGATLHYGGSWWVYSPTNILGTDAADVPRYQALTNVLVPFPALSVPLGNILATVAASQLPMNSGCTGTGPGACDDPNAILSKMFDLRHIAALFSPQGYTFPTVREGISCTEDGQCYVKDPDGSELPWSGQTVTLDPSAPFASAYDSLTETPDFSAIQPLTPAYAIASISSLGRGLNVAYNPFVLGTQCAICAPLVPNPDGKPVPGPVFEDPDAADTGAQSGAAERVEAVESVDAADSVNMEPLSESDVPTSEDKDPESVTTGTRHRRSSDVSDTLRQMHDEIKTGISRFRDGFEKPASRNSGSADSSPAPRPNATSTATGEDDRGPKKADAGSGSASGSDSGSGSGSDD